MSAEVVGDEELIDVAPRARLHLVVAGQGRTRVSTLGFAGMMALLVALGMGLVMVVATAVAAQSKELSALRAEATELGYEAAALGTQLRSTASTGSLALRAADLGMVPNPYPAFISLADGTILGEPRKVDGTEAPYLRGIRPAPARTPGPAAAQAAPPPSRAPSTAPTQPPPPAPARVDAAQPPVRSRATPPARPSTPATPAPKPVTRPTPAPSTGPATHEGAIHER